jgi:hypothetical protein
MNEPQFIGEDGELCNCGNVGAHTINQHVKDLIGSWEVTEKLDPSLFANFAQESIRDVILMSDKVSEKAREVRIEALRLAVLGAPYPDDPQTGWALDILRGAVRFETYIQSGYVE